MNGVFIQDDGARVFGDRQGGRHKGGRQPQLIGARPTHRQPSGCWPKEQLRKHLLSNMPQPAEANWGLISAISTGKIDHLNGCYLIPITLCWFL